MYCILVFQKLTTTPCFAGQSSSAVHLPVLWTGESGLTANDPGAIVTWLDIRHMDDNAYTIDRSSSEL